jgi:hypothetical protein
MNAIKIIILIILAIIIAGILFYVYWMYLKNISTPSTMTTKTSTTTPISSTCNQTACNTALNSALASCYGNNTCSVNTASTTACESCPTMYFNYDTFTGSTPIAQVYNSVSGTWTPCTSLSNCQTLLDGIVPCAACNALLATSLANCWGNASCTFSSTTQTACSGCPTRNFEYLGSTTFPQISNGTTWTPCTTQASCLALLNVTTGPPIAPPPCNVTACNAAIQSKIVSQPSQFLATNFQPFNSLNLSACSTCPQRVYAAAGHTSSSGYVWNLSIDLEDGVGPRPCSTNGSGTGPDCYTLAAIPPSAA